MEKHPDRLQTLAALCEQKLLTDPNYPRHAGLRRALALYRAAQQTGARIGGGQEPEKRGKAGEWSR